MSEDERAALLDTGEKALKMLENIFDRFLQEGETELAWDAKNQHGGAAIMLAWLNLITREDCTDRSMALLNRYMAVTYPKEAE